MASPNSLLTLDHDLPFRPSLNDTWEMASIEFDWVSGEMAPWGEHVGGRVYTTHFDQTVQGSSHEWLLRYRGKGGKLGSEDWRERTILSTVEDDSVATELRGRRILLGVRSRGPNKPVELGSLVMLLGPTQRTEQKKAKT
jgi:hypothetical protein